MGYGPSSPPGKCSFCREKPRFEDSTTGYRHPYCGRTCANLAKKFNPLNPSSDSNPAPLCIYCNRQPRYQEGQITHPFCGKGCATMAKNAGANMTVGSPAPVKRTCLYCGKSDKRSNSHYCSPRCAAQAQSTIGPGILEVPGDHVTFRNVVEQFMSSWKHPTPCPSVKQVWHVVSTKENADIYYQYLNGVERRGQFKAKGMSAGNENRRWHGTYRACRLGDEHSLTNLCSEDNCSVCRIIETSYDVNAYSTGTGLGRFGPGIYTSATSSKSNDYARRAGTIHSPYKAMLLNKVVVGNGYKILNDDPSMKEPPPGYDSVLGEVGGNLNYDELVVYTDEAIRPSYLVLYDAP